MYDWETFQTAYLAANQQQKNLVDSDLIPTCVQTVIIEHELTVALQSKLIRLAALHALNALPQPALETEIRKLGVSTSLIVSERLQKCLERPSSTSSPKPIRTMPADMQAFGTPDEITYTSTQSAILNEGKTPAAAPTPPRAPAVAPPPVPAPTATKPAPTPVVPPPIPKP